MVCIAKVFVVTFHHSISFGLHFFFLRSSGFRSNLGLISSHFFSFSPFLSLILYQHFFSWSSQAYTLSASDSHLIFFLSLSFSHHSLLSLSLFIPPPSFPTSLSLSLEASWKHYNNIIITKMSPLCLGFHYHVRSPALILFIYLFFPF